MNTGHQQRTSEIVRDIVYFTYDKANSDAIISELENAGYRTRVTSSLGETILCLREPQYAALIVGPLVQATDKALLASELRRRKSRTKIVSLCRDTLQVPTGADVVLNVQQRGGDDLVRVLIKLLASN